MNKNKYINIIRFLDFYLISNNIRNSQNYITNLDLKKEIINYAFTIYKKEKAIFIFIISDKEYNIKNIYNGFNKNIKLRKREFGYIFNRNFYFGSKIIKYLLSFFSVLNNYYKYNNYIIFRIHPSDNRIFIYRKK